MMTPKEQENKEKTSKITNNVGQFIPFLPSFFPSSWQRIVATQINLFFSVGENLITCKKMCRRWVETGFCDDDIFSFLDCFVAIEAFACSQLFKEGTLIGNQSYPPLEWCILRLRDCMINTFVIKPFSPLTMSSFSLS